jgi:hypothetical protein
MLSSHLVVWFIPDVAPLHLAKHSDEAGDEAESWLPHTGKAVVPRPWRWLLHSHSSPILFVSAHNKQLCYVMWHSLTLTMSYCLQLHLFIVWEIRKLEAGRIVRGSGNGLIPDIHLAALKKTIEISVKITGLLPRIQVRYVTTLPIRWTVLEMNELYKLPCQSWWC